MKKFLFVLIPLVVGTAGCSLIPPPSDLAAYDARGVLTTVAQVGEPVTFTCVGTDPFKIHLYMWDFGDGTITEWDKIKIDHTYKKPGTYEAHAKERCPLIFGETCLMRTGWSMSFKITIKEPTVTARTDAARDGELRADARPSLVPTAPPSTHAPRQLSVGN